MPCKLISFGDIDLMLGKLLANFERRERLPDILLVNFDLPGMDGLSFLKALESNALINEKTALYIFSTYKIPTERKEYAGVEQIKGFFKKPPSKKNILKIFEDFKKVSESVRDL